MRKPTQQQTARRPKASQQHPSNFSWLESAGSRQAGNSEQSQQFFQGRVAALLVRWFVWRLGKQRRWRELGGSR
jgi:hypothetical protein